MRVSWEKSNFLVMDFEGSLKKGIREAGFIYIVKGKIENAIEINGNLMTKEKLEKSLIELFSKNKFKQPLVYVAHHHTVEHNLIKAIMPYPAIGESGQRLQWGPWLDTKIIYSRLYPTEKELSLSKLAKKFDLFEELENYAEIYCNHKKNFFIQHYLTQSHVFFYLKEFLKDQPKQVTH